MHGDDVTAGGGCGAHCAVRHGSSGSADSATGKFWVEIGSWADLSAQKAGSSSRQIQPQRESHKILPGLELQAGRQNSGEIIIVSAIIGHRPGTHASGARSHAGSQPRGGVRAASAASLPVVAVTVTACLRHIIGATMADAARRIRAVARHVNATAAAAATDTTAAPLPPRYSSDALRHFGAGLLRAAGMCTEQAEVVAHVCVEGELLGHSTHGVRLLHAAIPALRRGTQAGEGEPTVLRDTGSTLSWDGARRGGQSFMSGLYLVGLISLVLLLLLSVWFKLEERFDARRWLTPCARRRTKL
jgi:hypothetical protein